MNTNYSEKIVKSQKPHTCDVCHGIIPIKQKYYITRTRMKEGEYQNRKYHIECKEKIK